MIPIYPIVRIQLSLLRFSILLRILVSYQKQNVLTFNIILDMSVKAVACEN